MAPYARFTLTAADGTVFAASTSAGPGYLIMAGVTGLDAPPYDFTSDESPGIDGEMVRAVRATARNIVLPMRIKGSSRSELVALRRALLGKCTPKAGPVTLTVAEPDGTSRWITGYLSDGVAGDTGTSNSGWVWQNYAPVLRCPEPYFTGPTITRDFYAPIVGQTWRFRLMPPVNYSAALTDTVLTNPGDQDAYPLWTLVGPLNSGLSATRPDTGEVWTLNYAVPAGRTVTLDCRPRLLTCALDDGTNLWPYLAKGSTLWKIPPGTIHAVLAYGGATAASRVRVAFAQRLEGA